MDYVELLALSLALSMDTFAMSIGVGAHGLVQGARPAFRLWFHCGLFQGLLAVLGWFLGTGLEKVIVTWDHWLACILLGLVGGKMVREGLQRPDPAAAPARTDPSRGIHLLSLSIATSLDALVVGVSLGVLRLTILYPALVIGLVTAGMSFVGLCLGRMAGNRLGKRMETLGGVALLLIAVKILWFG